MSTLHTLIDAQMKYGKNEQITQLGHEMFRMYTEMGFPPDMFLEEVSTRMSVPELAKIQMVSVYQIDFLEHRRKSGIDEKRIDKLRKKNLEDIERLITTGELGVY